MFIKKLSSFCLKNQPAVLLCLFGAFFYSFIIVYRYVHFSYGDWDQAYVSQSLWNLWHGRFYSSLFGFNVFGDHSNFINVLALPLFAVFPHPLTISFLAVFLFSASALLLYFMLLEELDRNSAFLLTFTYLWFPANFFAISHDFNSELLTPFFILLVIFFYRRNQIRNFYLSFLFLFLFKESMPLIVMMIACWGIFSKDRNRLLWGGVPMALSLIYFLLMVQWVIPHFRGIGQHSLWVRYRYIGANPWEIFLHLTRFKILVPVLVNPLNINYLRALFGILLIPALLSPSVLLLALPIILYHLLSNHVAEKTIFYYYAALITPVIFLAAGQTLKKFKFLYPFRRYICIFFLLFGCFQLYTYQSQIALKVSLNADLDVAQEWALVKMVPPDAGVVASFRFLPALSLRKDLYSFHKVYNMEYQNLEMFKKSDFYTGSLFKLPGNVSWALIDFNEDLLQRCLRFPEDKNRIDHFLKSWAVVSSVGAVKLYKKLN